MMNFKFVTIIVVCYDMCKIESIPSYDFKVRIGLVDICDIGFYIDKYKVHYVWRQIGHRIMKRQVKP